jgi:hypothetical protein
MIYILITVLLIISIIFLVKYLKNEKNIPNIVELEYFGEIDFNKTDEYYDVPTIINGSEISFDLNFIKGIVPKKFIQPAIDFISQIELLEKNATREIVTSFNEGKTVKEYIEHHLEEFNDEDLKVLGIDKSEDIEKQKDQMLNKIHLKRIGIYPEEPVSYGVFDYTINDDLTPYLIVVRFDDKGKIIETAMEN